MKFDLKNPVLIHDPPISVFLFSSSRSAWIWLLLRLWLGWAWVAASLHKITNPKWVSTGESVKGFWTRAVVVPETGKPSIAYDWYRSFIEFLLEAEAYTVFGPIIAYGELLVGIGLIVGAFVGISAFFGAFMNWNFIMSGVASTNGLLFTASILLMLAWKVAGYIGLDYFLLRVIGVPWKYDNEKKRE